MLNESARRSDREPPLSGTGNLPHGQAARTSIPPPGEGVTGRPVAQPSRADVPLPAGEDVASVAGSYGLAPAP